jgi:peptide/nickel transport system permease protein
MGTYVLRRLLVAIPTLFGVTIIIFLAVRILPGDPAEAMLSAGGDEWVYSEEQLEVARSVLGLDKPLHIQYITWIGGALRGDFGQSYEIANTTVTRIIALRFPITMQIALMSVALSWIIGVPVGIASARNQNNAVDHVLRFFTTLFLATPSFWLGMIMILFTVSVFLWRPPLMVVQLWEDPWANLQVTLGPSIALGTGAAAGLARVTRSSALEVLNSDFVRTARAKGLRERSVLWVHVLKNSLLPVVTISGLALGGLLGGAVAVETAFGVPGSGQSLTRALASRDYPVIQSLTLLFGVIYVFLNLTVDLIYGWLDPRIRYE